MSLQGIVFAIFVFISCFCVTKGTCPSGKYGYNCTLSCPKNCKYDRCHPGDGSCNGCDSKFWGQFCNLSCSSLCYSDCDQYDGYCDRCIAGRWKENCTKPCPGSCDSRGCDIITGICINKCIKGYHGSYCDQTCSAGCSECKRESGSCEECYTGYYGTFCNMSCPFNCKRNCNKATGDCYECIDEHWGLTCTEKCQHRCECEQLTGNCTKCRSGYCGKTCEKTCPYDVRRCTYDACEKDTCDCSACDGQRYMGKNCEQACPSPCSTCSMNGTCNSCFGGSNKYGPDCKTECKNCKHGCDFHTGYCRECVDGIFGENCDSFCTVNCKKCGRTTGLCFECLAGFWGEECNRACPESCNQKQCNKQSGNCLSCAGHAYGTYCEQSCSIHCTRRTYYRNDEICDREGVCLHQCQIGWWGPKCEDACMNCKASKCYHDTGICEIGCLSGYEMNGNNVCIDVESIPSTSPITTITQTTDSKSTLATIKVASNTAAPADTNKSILSVASFVLGITILVAILAIGGIYLCIRGRQRKDMGGLSTFNNPTEMVNLGHELEEPISQLTDAPIRGRSQISSVSGEYVNVGNRTDLLRPREQHLYMNH